MGGAGWSRDSRPEDLVELTSSLEVKGVREAHRTPRPPRTTDDADASGADDGFLSTILHPREVVGKMTKENEKKRKMPAAPPHFSARPSSHWGVTPETEETPSRRVTYSSFPPPRRYNSHRGVPSPMGRRYWSRSHPSIRVTPKEEKVVSFTDRNKKFRTRVQFTVTIYKYRSKTVRSTFNTDYEGP